MSGWPDRSVVQRMPADLLAIDHLGVEIHVSFPVDAERSTLHNAHSPTFRAGTSALSNEFQRS
jgi:hypothetical protein